MNTSIHYQGVEGSYSSGAARKIAKGLGLAISECVFVGHSAFDEVWGALKGSSSIAVLPIENSYAGTIHSNIYNFLKRDVTVVASYTHPINHCVLGVGTLDQLTEVYSHPQALAQTYLYCSNLGLTQHAWYDTAGAAEHIRLLNSPTIGAIASEQAATLYGLKILDQGVQDQSGNRTRFLAIQTLDGSRHGDTHYTLKPVTSTAILVHLIDRPGALHAALGVFASRSVTLNKIESLPHQGSLGGYVFWMELERPGELIRHECYTELSALSASITDLGVFGQIA